ncbi:S1C family serine protease [Paenibacillus guangzhouensis]|uniref:S1C family serine protease n=1 Tax=Paenibacillus guangzhouensis TaxID=1473112 RepID=UPI00126726E8|nr:trypsin-like peptidase domain-containing protein [Paenibacillus guangzhouensis]
MSFFDDDFYSPKVSKPIKKLLARRAARGLGPRKRWSTLQISVVSSVCSAAVGILLFSWITGAGSHVGVSARPDSGMEMKSQGAMSSDPFERIIDVSDQVSPSVVSVVNRQKKDAKTVDAGLGSGIIFRKEEGRALILTNAHVIEGANAVQVVLNNNARKIEATVVGKDHTTDIAVLSVEDDNLPEAAVLGDSTKLRRGEMVLAIGNALGLGDSLSYGIISKTLQVVPVSLSGDGTYDWEAEVIQTDAAINEGNSGGALVNLQGQVIGVNSMKIADVGVEGIGFAIPINQAMKIANEIIQEGRVIRAYMGVYTIDLNNDYAPITEEQRKSLKLPSTVKDGVIVMEASGPSASAGLELNDVIVKLDNQEVDSTLELRKYLYQQKKVGDTMLVSYYREGKGMTTEVKLTDRPQE